MSIFDTFKVIKLTVRVIKQLEEVNPAIEKLEADGVASEELKASWEAMKAYAADDAPETDTPDEDLTMAEAGKYIFDFSDELTKNFEAIDEEHKPAARRFIELADELREIGVAYDEKHAQ